MMCGFVLLLVVYYIEFTCWFPVSGETKPKSFLLKRKLIFRMNQHIRPVLRVLKHGTEGEVAAGDAAILDVGRVSGE